MSDERRKVDAAYVILGGLPTDRYGNYSTLDVVATMLAFADAEVARERKEAFNAGMAKAEEICREMGLHEFQWAADAIRSARDGK
jgi:hypothetical protein